MGITVIKEYAEIGYYIISSLAGIATLVMLIVTIKNLSNLNKTLNLNKEELELNKKQLPLLYINSFFILPL